MEELTIGPYARNATEAVAYNLVDQHGFVVDPEGRAGDALGANFDAFFAYDDPLLPKVAKDMWYFNSQGKYVGQRHPEIPPEDHPMSRDHYMSTLLMFKLFNTRRKTTLYDAKIKEITDETGFIISKMARRGFGLAWWSKAIQGKAFYQFLWHWFEIISAVFVYIPLHFLLARPTFSNEVEQWEYVKNPTLQELPKWKTWIDDITYPSYALQNAGWTLYVTNDKLFPVLRTIQKLLYRSMVGKTNYVQKMLFGKKNIPQEKILLYQPMRGGRWGGYLSERNDRNMQILTPKPQYNNIDCDVARRLWNETQL